MYPNLGFFFEHVLGIKIPFLSYAQTFGFFVAIAFLIGAWVISLELKRKAALGLVKPQEIINKKTGKKELIFPHQRVSDIVFIAAIAGFIGAKVFNALETWDDFIVDPIGSLFSRSGLTFYGGLIFATIALYVFSRKIKLSFKQLCDAAAPALILAYGIGRLGCHFAGDGDWGVYNSAYISQQDGTLIEATLNDYEIVAQKNAGIMEHFEGKIPNIYYPANGLPRWLIAMNYANNVNNDGIPINGENKEYNYVLPVAVFPTPIWEAIICIFILFPILWSLRKKFNAPLQLFGLYLFLNGLERFLVEKVRVNTRIDLGFIQPTQAEVISTLLMITGIALLIFLHKKKDNNSPDLKTIEN
ncbi:MAG TPA: prolipoprotein diacylglyceryl transferase family protein [Edaphocola sp.]|nr:prolipoprotein diacylglyceryl transferase family protein [Edaphocola sp.]